MLMESFCISSAQLAPCISGFHAYQVPEECVDQARRLHHGSAHRGGRQSQGRDRAHPRRQASHQVHQTGLTDLI